VISALPFYLRVCFKKLCDLNYVNITLQDLHPPFATYIQSWNLKFINLHEHLKIEKHKIVKENGTNKSTKLNPKP